ncbi:MAG: phosphatidylserine decarboxylase [Alphaproteobacteria bacterium]|nr:phosphatidylserine decarboxylase [Alphaproteobacteria bacterium]
MLKDIFVPIHKEGWPFIGFAAFITFVFFLMWTPLVWPCLLITLWIIYFFRDPERIHSDNFNGIISPADGVVQNIRHILPPEELCMKKEPHICISIFMNIFNVHVNRIPASGKITELVYKPGKFFNASLDKASEFNERQMVKLKLDNDQEIAFVQIAGLVARRIVCYLKIDQTVSKGERFGLIRFGSRVDLYIPNHFPILVEIGQTMVAGETIIAQIPVSLEENSTI